MEVAKSSEMAALRRANIATSVCPAEGGGKQERPFPRIFPEPKRPVSALKCLD